MARGAIAAKHPGPSLGIDVGGTKVRAALADSGGQIWAEETVSAQSLRPDFVAGIATLVRSLNDQHVGEVRGIGIGLPGVVNQHTGRVSRCPAYPELDSFDVLRAIERELKLPVAADNDANLAAWGEYVHGNHGVSSLASLALGTGVGLGLVVDGRLLVGEHGAAGEVADVPLYHNGQRLPLETQVSVSGLLAVRGLSWNGSVPRLLAEATSGDAEAELAVHAYCKRVVDAIATLVAIVDPGAVVLTGGIGARAVIVASITSMLTERDIGVPVMVSEFGDRAPLLGALAIATDHTASARERVAPDAVV